MRRALLILLAAVLLSLAAAVPAAHALPSVGSGQQGVALQRQSNDGEGAPSIIPSPNQRGKNNLGGLIVGVVLLGGWIGVGFVIFRQGHRRLTADSSNQA